MQLHRLVFLRVLREITNEEWMRASKSASIFLGFHIGVS
jgi:hypothetical protein